MKMYNNVFYENSKNTIKMKKQILIKEINVFIYSLSLKFKVIIIFL
ncbi:hypothetical protein CoNPh17_CDS0131 [Staphylococcus phage S-CoN_Ph17]|nr:hypothetical protein CoNPh17_CDS0131 [Staphylococcus phage S-CoN_Ph17]